MTNEHFLLDPTSLGWHCPTSDPREGQDFDYEMCGALLVTLNSKNVLDNPSQEIPRDVIHACIRNGHDHRIHRSQCGEEWTS